MTMTFDDAKKIERPPIEIGRQYTFYSTMQQDYEPPEQRMRNYTGQLVTVLAWENEDEWREEQAQIAIEVARGETTQEDATREIEPLFKVRAKNGFEFSANDGELNGWFCDTGQFFWPDATYGPEHDEAFLVNERQS